MKSENTPGGVKTSLESDANSDGEKETRKEKDCSHNVEQDEKEGAKSEVVLELR